MTHKCGFAALLRVTFVLLVLTASWGWRPALAQEAPPGWMVDIVTTLAGGTNQALLVTNDDASRFQAIMYLLEKKEGIWRTASTPVPALIGEKGFAAPGEKREGDLRTPSGLFALKRAFGYAATIPSRMPYGPVDKNDLWVDDTAAPDYNRWVRRGKTTAKSFEIMKLDDDRYKYGIVIEYNTDPIIRGLGSAIFIHVRRGELMPTLGCVALVESDLLKVLSWLDPAAKPQVILGTRVTLDSLAGKAREQAGGSKRSN